MKRLTVWKKLRLLRSARRSLKSRQRHRRWRRTKSHGGFYRPEAQEQVSLLHVTFYKRGKTRHGFARAKTLMPEHFCLIENYEPVAEFLADLRHNLTISGQKLEKLRAQGSLRKRARNNGLIADNYFDFASLKRITPASALVLASEFDRATSVFNAPENWLHAIDIEQWDPSVLKTLDDVGFLSLLGVEPQKNAISLHDGVYTVPFVSGVKVHGAMIDRLIRGMAALADGTGMGDSETLLNRSRVYDGLGEAIQNVEDHAYPLGAFGLYPVARKWWMGGAVEPSKKRFTISIYDHGVSIPVSLPRWKRFGDFKTAFATVVGREYSPTSPEHDGQTIAQAVELGRTSTGKAWHGKGLPVIRDIIENCQDGTVRILSRNGLYSCSKGAQPNYLSHHTPITGTLIEWDMFL